MMRYSREQQATEFVDSIIKRERCLWCRDPSRVVYRQGLCRPCYEKGAQLKRAQKLLSDLKSRGKSIPFEVKHQADALREAITDCKELGIVLDRVLQGGDSPLDLEWDLCWLSRRICRKDLFKGMATQLGWVLGPGHRRFLRALIWRIISVDASRHRIGRALSQLHRKALSSKEGAR